MPAAVAAVRRLGGSWSLRRRLVVTVTAVVTLVSVLIGVGSLLALRGFLVEQLDERLHTMLERSVTAVGARPLPVVAGEDSTPERILLSPSSIPGMLVVFHDGERLEAGYLDEDNTVRALTTEQLTALMEGSGSGPVRGVDLGGELGDYRVILAVTGPGVMLIGLPTSSIDATLSQLAWTVAVISCAGVAILVAVAATYIRYELRPLERVARTATRVSRLPLDRGDVVLGERVADGGADTRTEVGKVVSAFNRMLGHIEQALSSRQASEERMRRFVADASHELRTPLAAIRGYSEFTRRMAEDLPRDAGYALDRIESESVRMTSLVEDLLLLARLDEGRELARAPVGLTGLVIDAVNDARMAGPDHEWLLETEREPVETIGDQHRLQQVIGNLLANARIHTPPGTRVTVTLATDPAADSVVLTVADNGPGIPEEARATLFERFTRADSSRARSTGSTGLGLAIVRAVVQAHGGTVTVSSEPGSTVFTTRLPASPSGAG